MAGRDMLLWIWLHIDPQVDWVPHKLNGLIGCFIEVISHTYNHFNGESAGILETDWNDLILPMT